MEYSITFLHLPFSLVQGEAAFDPRGGILDNLKLHLIKYFRCAKHKLPIKSKAPDAKYFSSVKKMALFPTFSWLSSGMEEESRSRGQHDKEYFQIIYT